MEGTKNIKAPLGAKDVSKIKKKKKITTQDGRNKGIA